MTSRIAFVLLLSIVLGMVYGASTAPSWMAMWRPQSTATPEPPPPTLPFPLPLPPGGPLPPATATPEDMSDPAARAILVRSDEAMNALSSMRMKMAEQVRPRGGTAEPPANAGEHVFAAPDRMHYVQDRFRGDYEVIGIGRDVWRRSDGTWEHRASSPAFAWPDFRRNAGHGNGSRRATINVRLVREDDLPSGPVWVIGYQSSASSFEGRFNVFITEWIDRQTYRLMRQEVSNDDPWGSGALIIYDRFEFDVPVSIEAPVAVSGELGSTPVFLPSVANHAAGLHFDPRTGSWELIPDSNVFGGEGASAVWTGSKLLVWGGVTWDDDGDAVLRADGVGLGVARR